ncbi:MAG: RHS repeat-associated core domain-containing protein [Thermodesulfobacteriota bacterium]|nr:RHS repeat-associated core domain-containing protein [Thermodesulfobacteriota bacterium]
MPVAVEKEGVLYYLAYNQVGSLRAVADSAGNIVKQIEYDSHGYILNDTNPGFDLPFGFAGGLHDRDTGLVRFGYRDYDPDTGRWTAKDPIGFAGGDSDLYGYVLNDPVNLVDPWGLESSAGYLNEFSRDMSVNGGPPPGVEADPAGVWNDIGKIQRFWSNSLAWVLRAYFYRTPIPIVVIPKVEAAETSEGPCP